jgi:Ran GTPase-activating protein (RanGAP) involved in mRNA processing and transport
MNHEKLPQSMQETSGLKASDNGIAVESSHGSEEGSYNTTSPREPSCLPASATFDPSTSIVGSSTLPLYTPTDHLKATPLSQAHHPHPAPFSNPLHQLSLSGHAQASVEPRTSPRPTRESVLRRLSEALLRRSLTVIDMSQRDLQPSDSKLIKIAVMQNINLHTLKLGYNHLGDEGLITLAPALAHSNLQSLDLGFTGVGDGGMEALANSFLQGDVRSTSGLLTKKRQKQIRQSKLNTLYLSGNCITTRGCLALSKMIQFGSCKLKKLHLTGNRIGVDGVRSLTRAVSLPSGFAVAAGAESAHHGVGENTIQELFLGGTGIGSEGCHAVAEMLSNVRTLRVLSLADNYLGDRECNILSDAIKRNREHLPLEALQLSFNRISCVGVESLMNAVWGSTSLQEIRLDNNCIGDRGAQLIAVVVANVPSLKRLDVGFSSFTAVGMRALMKSIAESDQIVSLSISGNKLDTDGAKAVAYALAYNRSLKYFFMDNCAANHASQRHITAGIVSNSQVSLHTLTGFRIGGENCLL